MIGVTNREQLPPIVAAEFDALVTRLQAQLNSITGTTTGSTSIAELLAAVNALTASVSALSSAAERTAHKDQASGYAGLDASSRVLERLAPTETTNSTTGTQNNLSFSAADALLFTNGVATTVTGIVAGYTGQIVLIMANGVSTVKLSHLSASSSAANQFKNNGAADLTLAAGTGRACYRYSGSQWVQLW